MEPRSIERAFKPSYRLHLQASRSSREVSLHDTDGRRQLPLRSAVDMSDWLDAEAHAHKAQEMYQRGRWAEAEAELRKALSLNPDHAEWHYNLGLTLEAAGRDADALASYERATTLMPDEVDPMLAAAVTSNRLGQHEQALKWLERVLRLDEHSEVAHAQKVDALWRIGHHDEAETACY